MGAATFVILSFEGPDQYSHAGGLGSRIRGLSSALAQMGNETHLFFIGDPDLPGYETKEVGRLHLHRWCQWISRYHPGGVYDGESGKEADWSDSIAPWLETELLAGKVAAGEIVVVLAEEWQTVRSVIALGRVIERNGWTHRVRIFWNLNNPFGAERIDWPALRKVAIITTVSRYMKQFMWRFGVDARVVPNGISHTWFDRPEGGAVADIRRLLNDRLTLVKVARGDPDKRWNMTIDAVAVMKQQGLSPVLLARGGVEPHGDEVIARARRRGLSVAPVSWSSDSPKALVLAISPVAGADVIDLRGYLNQRQLKVLYQAADAVIANSGVEPFGLVGLEVMACGGLAFVGATGEDYVTPGYDAVSLQTDSPDELAFHAAHMKLVNVASRAIRRSARRTALRYAWPSVVRRVLNPMIEELGGRLPLMAGDKDMHDGSPDWDLVLPASSGPGTGRRSRPPKLVAPSLRRETEVVLVGD